MSEFADLLSLLCFKFKRIFIWGDFNIHIDQTNSLMTKDLAVLECFNLTQFVNASTRSKGHTLDLVIANESLLLSILVFLTILQYFFQPGFISSMCTYGSQC